MPLHADATADVRCGRSRVALLTTGVNGALRAAFRTMLVAAPVTIVINGSIVSSSIPAHVTGGRVMTPLTPLIARLGSRVVYDWVRRTVTVERNGEQIVVPVVFESGAPYIEVGRVVNGLGGDTAFDSRSKTLAIVISEAAPIATPTAYRGSVIPGVSAPLATPRALPAQPAPDDGSVPRPRRTAIPALPSQPVASPSERDV